jgi:hypothetical protein
MVYAIIPTTKRSANIPYALYNRIDSSPLGLIFFFSKVPQNLVLLYNKERNALESREQMVP